MARINNRNSKLEKSSDKYPPLKESRGNEREVPPATSDGHVIGAASAKKGFDHAKLIRHDGIVLGGSITKKRTPTPEKQINRLASGGKRTIIGSDL